jgi:hypothetical protein
MPIVYPAVKEIFGYLDKGQITDLAKEVAKDAVYNAILF